MRSHFFNMHKRSQILVLLLSALFLGSCSTTKIMPKNCAQVRSPKKLPVYSKLWGLIEDKKLKNSDLIDCQGNGLSSVTVKVNAKHVLITLLTLGIVVPMDIYYDCAKDGQLPPP